MHRLPLRLPLFVSVSAATFGLVLTLAADTYGERAAAPIVHGTRVTSLVDASHDAHVARKVLARLFPDGSSDAAPADAALPEAGHPLPLTGPASPAPATPAQRARKAEYLAKTLRHIRALVHADGKELTDAERRSVEEHWQVALRLLRVRDVAEAEGDAAGAEAARELLQDAELRLYDHLLEMNQRAPAAPRGTVP